MSEATGTLDRSKPQPPVARYAVESSGRGLDDCLAEINRSNFECYGPDYCFGARQGKIVVDTLFGYERLLRGLAGIPHLEFVPHGEMLARGCPDDKILCSIRHDIDSDIRAAVAQAHLERDHGARTTHFVLHTAPYYGAFVKGTFRRNDCMAILYRELQSLGQEVALHTDPLHVYQNLGIDGAEAIRVELEWLRSEGLEITGTVAHNSASVYGIENSAIFAGRNRRGLALDAPSDDETLLEEIVHEGKWAPLGVVDEASIGLRYEGNDLFRQNIPVEYGATRRLNRWRWNAHLRRRKHWNPSEDRFIDQDRLLAEIETLPPGRWLILNVHPLYYGSRHVMTSAPPLRIDRLSVATNEQLGWETYAPDVTQAVCVIDDGRQEAQSINYSDATGMLDTPRPEASRGAELRIALLGGRNVDGRTVGVPEHLNQQAALRLSELLDRPVWVRKLAFPGMGLCRHFGWLECALSETSPHVVLIGLGADELAASLPEHWSASTGFDGTHPPGDYLRYDGAAVSVVERSAGAAIRRGLPRSTDLPSLTEPDGATRYVEGIEAIAACLRHYAEVVRGRGALPVGLVQECGESVGLWAPGVDAADRRAAHDRFAAICGGWESAAGIPIIDPYARMLEQPPSLPAHWRGASEWNCTGHRLAAAAMIETIVELIGSGSEARR